MGFKTMNTKNELLDYMNGRFTLNDVFEQIQKKCCKLPRRVRDYVCSHYDANGKFVKGDNYINHV